MMAWQLRASDRKRQRQSSVILSDRALQCSQRASDCRLLGKRDSQLEGPLDRRLGLRRGCRRQTIAVGQGNQVRRRNAKPRLGGALAAWLTLTVTALHAGIIHQAQVGHLTPPCLLRYPGLDLVEARRP